MGYHAGMLKPLKHRWAQVLALLAAGMAFMAGMLSTEREWDPEAESDKITIGMERVQVEQTLGKPTMEIGHGSGALDLFYFDERFWRRTKDYLWVELDKDHKYVTRKEARSCGPDDRDFRRRFRDYLCEKWPQLYPYCISVGLELP
jgi:hypothetical protein